MESLCHILCVRCYSAVGKDNEVLLCNSCKLWQHRKCSEGVSQSFYLEFYLATVLGEKPAPWKCHYCSQYQSTVKAEQASPSKATTNPTTEKNLNSSLQLPPNPPVSLTSDDNSGYDSDSSSFDEFNLNCEIQRNEREGPATYPATSTTSVNNQSTPVSIGKKVIINSQPIFSDTSRDPTLYTLYQTSDGQKEVNDNLGNVFTSSQVKRDTVTLYQCSTTNCGFKVRVCETIKEFLSAGSQSSEDHNHNSVSANPTCNQDNASTDTMPVPDKDSSTTDTNDETRSFILPEITSTPHHLPTSRKCASTRFSDSYCSDTTDDEDSNLVLLATSIQRFTALNRPTPRVPLNVSFSSDSDSDDNCAVSVLCDRLNVSSDNDNDRFPPSPTSTIPAMDSSDSSDSENVTTATTYQVTKATSSARALLTDSLGYTYNIKFRLEARTFWCCTEKSRCCPASVIQSSRDHFTMGVATHNHPSIQSKIHFPSLTPPSPQPDQSQQSVENPSHQSATTESNETTEPGTNPPSPVTTDTSQPEPETNIVVTKPTNGIVFHEIEACLPRQKKPSSLLVSSNGFIFQTKIEDLSNNKTTWHCTETALNGTKCKVSVEFDYLQPFSHDPASGRTWLVNRENGRLTHRHNHMVAHSAVVMAKVRMMIRRRIFQYGLLDEVPKTMITSIFDGIDYKGHAYLDSIGSPVLKTSDTDYLPCSPVQIQVLKRFIVRQKVLYRQQKNNEQ